MQCAKTWLKLWTRKVSTQCTYAFSLDMYHSSLEINCYLDSLFSDGKNSSHKTYEIGKTFEERPIIAAVLNEKASKSSEKPVIVIEAGSQGREWITTMAAIYSLDALLNNNKALADRAVWIIVPLLNPDGYEFSRNSFRLWRKNRNLTDVNHCKGVDLNRNYCYMWGAGGFGKNPCYENYAGKNAFSELETISLRNFLEGYKSKIKLYISLHSPHKSILYPWSYDKTPPPDKNELKKVAMAVRNHVYLTCNTFYGVGQFSMMHRPVGGTSIDWAKHDLGAKYAYNIELPGPMYGYETPPSYIKSIGRQLVEMLKVFADSFGPD